MFMGILKKCNIFKRNFCRNSGNTKAFYGMINGKCIYSRKDFENEGTVKENACKYRFR